MNLWIWIFTAMTFFGHLHAQKAPAFTVSHSICESVAGVPAGSWIVVDLDDTIVTEAQTLGSDRWFGEEVERQMAVQGRSYEQIRAQMMPIKKQIKSLSHQVLIEPCLPQILRDLQAKGVIVFAITARYATFAAASVRTVNALGIDFTRSALPAAFQNINWSDLPTETVYTEGIFVISESDKGRVLERLVESVPQRPPFIQTYDDQIRNVTTEQRAAAQLGIPSTVFHFSAKTKMTAAERQRLADFEFQDLIERGMKGPLMSDNQAMRGIRALCEQLLENAALRQEP